MSRRPPEATVGLGFLKLGLGEAVARVIGFSATVYLARHLGAGSYGMVVLATTVISYVSVVSDCGINLLGVRDVAHRPVDLPDLLRTWLGARLQVTAALVALTAGAALLALPHPDGAVLALYALTLLPLALSTRWVHLGLEQMGRVSIARTATEAFTALLVVTLIRTPEDVMRVPIAVILGEALGAFLLLRALPRAATSLAPLFRLDTVVGLYRRAWPLVVNAVLGLAVLNGDSFFLRTYRDAATVGQYAVGYTLVTLLVNLGQAYQASLLPVVTRLQRDPVAQHALYDTAMAHVVAATLPIAVGCTLVADRLIPAVFGDGYRHSVQPLQILVWSIPPLLVRGVAQNMLLAQGRQNLILRLGGWAAGLNLVLNAALIPGWGMWGAALATVATETVRTVPTVWFARRASFAWVSVRRHWRALVATGAMAMAVQWLDGGSAWPAIATGVCVYLGSLFVVGGIRRRRGALPELAV